MYDWTDILFFCTWKIWFTVALFLIYGFLPLCAGGILYFSIKKYGRFTLGDTTLALAFIIGWIFTLAILYNTSPTMIVGTYTSLSGIKTHSIITSIENSLKDSLLGYVKHEQETALPYPPIRKVIGTEVRAFELLSWKEPLHVYVDVKDVKTGVISRDIYVSKYCTAAYQLKAHEIYHAKVNIVLYDDKQVYEFVDLPATFCSR